MANSLFRWPLKLGASDSYVSRNQKREASRRKLESSPGFLPCRHHLCWKIMIYTRAWNLYANKPCSRSHARLPPRIRLRMAIPVEHEHSFELWRERSRCRNRSSDKLNMALFYTTSERSASRTRS